MNNLDYATIVGKAASTMSNWLGVSPQPQLVAFLCLLEQLTSEERHAAIDALCRPLPLLDHPWLAHSPSTVTALKNLLRQNAGLTLVNGKDAEQRAFLISALGHTFCRLAPAHRKPAGIDLHEPDKFVPVETLYYLRDTHRPSETVAAIHSLWPAILSAKRPLILLNGVWSQVPELHRAILALAHQQHIIIAEKDVLLPTKPALKTGLPVHQLTVSRSRRNPEWIEVGIKVK